MNTSCEFWTGPAGSGKTTAVRKMIEQDPTSALLCATTGIAAVNLDAVTINSVFGYYDTDSLTDAYISGQVARKYRGIAKDYKAIAVDEVSMLGKSPLDTHVMAISEVNDELEKKMGDDPFEDGDENDTTIVRNKLGIILTGDFCFGAKTEIMRADGRLERVENLLVGDEVMGPNGKPRKILRLFRGQSSLYRIEQTNGMSYVVTKNHPLFLIRGENGKREDGGYLRYRKLGNSHIISAPELIKKSQKFRETFVGYKIGALTFPSKTVTVDPYFLGLWLGDGDSDACRITTADPEVLSYCTVLASKYELGITTTTWPERTKAYRIALSSQMQGSNALRNPLWYAMKGMGLKNNKHIPDSYQYNNEDVRLHLLAGLLDSDGSWTGNRYVFCSSFEKLAKNVKQLADQLGFRTGFYSENDAWLVTIGGDTWRIPCRIQRKKSLPRNLGRSRMTSVLSITPIGRGPFYGFETDSDHLFLLGDGTVAHNCQLPPIKEDWAFNAECWPEFDEGTKRFDKIHRQSNPEFMEALQQLRHGEGGNAADLLEKLGVDFHIAIKHDFDGTTIMAKNDKVGRFNVVALSKLPGQKIVFQTVRTGQLRSEWKHIPEQQEFKIGALVMMLTNKHMGGEMVYANGEEGHILDYRSDGSYLVQLLRGNSIVNVEPLVRNNEVRELPKYMKNDPVAMSQVWRNEKTKRWVIGSITYMPMRLAYATTCHKSQGLSLDRVQVDIRDGFFGKPNMLYVALSRARNPEGLRIVGSKDQFVKRCKIAEEVRRWL